MTPRAEAEARVGGRFDVRVLEPSPPAVTVEPFADDPVAPEPREPGRRLVSPVPNGDLTWDELARDEPELATFCADRWLGAWRRLQPIGDPGSLRATRASWHALAEQVLAPARRRANGRIGLRFTRDGFGTPFFGEADQLRVAGQALVAVRDGTPSEHPITTLAAAGAAAGIEPGAPADLYPPSTDVHPDETLPVDAGAAGLLADWIGFACSVLEEVRAEARRPVDAPSLVQLWPEHFDLGVDIGAEGAGRRGTFGASPGDAEHPEPYLYVTHWSEVPADRFWNDSAFAGASLDYGEIVTAADQRAAALAFLRAGRAVLSGHRADR
jgi:hypothetical protein